MGETMLLNCNNSVATGACCEMVSNDAILCTLLLTAESKRRRKSERERKINGLNGLNGATHLRLVSYIFVSTAKLLNH